MPDVMHTIERLARRNLVLRGARSHMVANGHGRVHVIDVPGRGTLPTLVLVHGFSASAGTQYGGLIKLLRPHFRRIVAPDLPGHGLSDLPAGGITGTGLVHGLRDALAALLDTPAIFFASSLGGAIAARYASQYPQLVGRLMLCSPGGAPLATDERASFLRQFEISSHRRAVRFVDSLFASKHPMRHLLAWGVRRNFNRPHLIDLLGRVDEGDYLTPGELAALQMPLLMLWGEAERVLPRSSLEFFRAHLPGHTRFEQPTRFGHAPFLDQPRAVAQHILDFARGPEHRSADAPSGPAACRLPA